MKPFHVVVHMRPAGIAAGEIVRMADCRLQTLTVPPGQQAAMMAVSFEQVVEAMAALPHLLTEPDGSFVWNAVPGARPPWQIGGNLRDRGGRLFAVELIGSCPERQFDALLRTVGWPQAPIMFQLVRHAVFVDEAEFRRFAFTATKPA